MSDSAGTAPAAAGDSPSGPGPGGPADFTRVGSKRDGGPGRIRSISVFYRQVVAELRKVIWPTRRELLSYTSVVLVFVLIMVLVVSAFDFAFSQVVLAVFGGESDAA